MDKKKYEKARVKAVRKKRRKTDIDILMQEVSDEELKMPGFMKFLSDGSLFVRDWIALGSIPQESETHVLKVDEYSAGLYCKEPEKHSYDYIRYSGVPWQHWLPKEEYNYLSTHTFYGSQYKHSTELLRLCGFNVTVNNWDRPN